MIKTCERCGSRDADERRLVEIGIEGSNLLCCPTCVNWYLMGDFPAIRIGERYDSANAFAVRYLVQPSKLPRRRKS